MEKVIIVVWMLTKWTCSSILAYRTYHGGLHVLNKETVCLYLMGELGPVWREWIKEGQLKTMLFSSFLPGREWVKS